MKLEESEKIKIENRKKEKGKKERERIAALFAVTGCDTPFG